MRTNGLRMWALVLCAGLAATASRGSDLTVSLSPTAANFGSVTVGSSKTVAVMITNTGQKSLDLNQETLIGNMFSVSGMTVPKIIAAGAHVIFSVKFAPTTAGTHDGSLEFGVEGSDDLVTLQLSGQGVASTQGTLTATPSSVSFGSVPVGTTASQTLQLKNTGTSSLAITALKASGTGFSMCSGTLPYTLGAGLSMNCQVSYTPTAVATASGQATFTSTATDSTLTVPLSGTGGTATRTLTATPTSLNFGSDAVGSTQTLTVALQNTGNSSVTVSGVSVSGSGITAVGVSGVTIAAGQTATLDVSFAPKQTGTVSGSVTIVSNATVSPKTSVLGDGVSATAHSVTLNWNASTSSGVTGYDVYRATLPSTTYAKLNSTPLSGTTYTDGSVVAGASYKYATTAVNSSGQQSMYSVAITVVVP